MRNCRDAGIALVPCDPTSNVCPTAQQLGDVPPTYTTLGTPPHNKVMQCVPLESITIPQEVEEEEVPGSKELSVEEQEHQLDKRFKASTQSILDQKQHLKDMGAWIYQAPCSAISAQNHTLTGACKFMRFPSRRDGSRCIVDFNECQDNLISMRKMMDKSIHMLMSHIRNMKRHIESLRTKYNEDSLEQLLFVASRNVKQQYLIQKQCERHTDEKSCNMPPAGAPRQCQWEGTRCSTLQCPTYDGNPTTCAETGQCE